MTTLRPCVGCQTLIAITARRCPECQRAYNRRGGSRRVRGRYDAAHVKLRAKLLRERPWCAECRAVDSPENPLELDHVVAWSRGGQSVRANAQLLCRAHNRSKGARDGA